MQRPFGTLENCQRLKKCVPLSGGFELGGSFAGIACALGGATSKNPRPWRVGDARVDTNMACLPHLGGHFACSGDCKVTAFYLEALPFSEGLFFDFTALFGALRKLYIAVSASRFSSRNSKAL